MADRIAVLKDGVIRQLGTPEELYNYPADCFCAEFLGDINIVPGAVEDGYFVSPLGKLLFVQKYEGEKLCGIIRPERIRFADAEGEGVFKAVLLEKTFLGESCDWLAESNGIKLYIRENAPAGRKAGSEVLLKFDEGFFQLVPERD